MVIKSPPVPLPAMVFTITDVALTSSVGLSWSFNGLVDVGLVKETWKLYTVRDNHRSLEINSPSPNISLVVGDGSLFPWSCCVMDF